MPVVKAEPPVMAAEVVGSIVERELLHALWSGRASAEDPIEKHMSPPLPQVGAGESVASLMSTLEGADAAVVLDEGFPVGVVTRTDLLGYLSSP